MKKVLLYTIAFLVVASIIAYVRASFYFLDFTTNCQIKSDSLLVDTYKELVKEIPADYKDKQDILPFLKKLLEVDTKYELSSEKKAIREKDLDKVEKNFAFFKEKLSSDNLKNTLFLKLQIKYFVFLENLMASDVYNPDYIFVPMLQADSLLDLFFVKLERGDFSEKEKKVYALFLKRLREKLINWEIFIQKEKKFFVKVLKEFSLKYRLSFLLLKITGKLPEYKFLDELFSQLEQLPKTSSSYEVIEGKLKLLRKKFQTHDLLSAAIFRIPWEKVIYFFSHLNLKINLLISIISGKPQSDPFSYAGNQKLYVNSNSEYYSVGKNGIDDEKLGDDLGAERVFLIDKK